MYKPHSKHTLSAQLNAFQKMCPNPSTQVVSKTPNYSSKFDLQKFNDYLQQRISRKANRNGVEVSRRESSQKRSSHELNYREGAVPQNIQKDLGLQKFRESRVSKSREILSPKITWRKHESIQNLLEKENHSVLSGNRRTESQSQEYALRQLEKKYQQLQQKYKNLMKEASENARVFQADKRELTKIKMVHQQDQQVLSRLRKELVILHENMNKTMETPLQKSVLKCKSQQMIDSDSSTILGSLHPVHQTWKSKEGWEEKGDNLKFSRNKTTENWRTNFDKSIVVPPSQSKNRTKELRYYSAEKQSEGTRKPKKVSEHSQYGNVQSKTSIKCGDSLRGSKIRVSAKPGTETLIRLQNEFSKNGVSTLQKKMISSNQYSKYRFKPTFKCE